MRIIRTTGEVRIITEPGDSRDLRDIAMHHLPEWLELFARKNADYGSEGARVLGVRGQYADINRKILKLKRAVWDGEQMNFEGPAEITLDLIGHLFLMRQLSADEEAESRARAYGALSERPTEDRDGASEPDGVPGRATLEALGSEHGFVVDEPDPIEELLNKALRMLNEKKGN